MGNIERLLDDLRSLTQLELRDVTRIIEESREEADLDKALSLFRAALAIRALEMGTDRTAHSKVSGTVQAARAGHRMVVAADQSEAGDGASGEQSALHPDREAEHMSTSEQGKTTEGIMDAINDVGSLTDEEWLTLEFMSLRNEAAAVAQSLDNTLAYVRSRCDMISRVG